MDSSPVLAAFKRKRLLQAACPSFTLVEMVVAMAILLSILGIVFGLTLETSKAWKNTTGKVEVFRNARGAFDAMTRTLSQATLNTYYDYACVNGSTLQFLPVSSTTAPTVYARNSDLQIVSGQGSTLLPGLTSHSGDSITAITHAVFFQAPLGMATNTAYVNLDGLLNACGFYVAYGPDLSSPDFLASTARYRYRLMQYTQASDNLSIYALGKGSAWYLTPIQADLILATPLSDFALAENIIALVILPKLSPKDELQAETAYALDTATTPLGTALAPTYSYDSATMGQGGAVNANGISQRPWLNSFNQMPPVFQVTMVAIDEASALRLGNTPTPPNATIGLTPNLFTQAKNFAADLTSLETTLSAAHINFRVFQTDVAVRGSKWTNSN